MGQRYIVFGVALLLALGVTVVAIGLFGGAMAALSARSAAPGAPTIAQPQQRKNRADRSVGDELGRSEAQRAKLEEMLDQAKRDGSALQEQLNARTGNSRTDGGLK